VSPPNDHGEELARLSAAGHAGPAARPAATVILVRDAEAGAEALLLRRNSRIAFGGMWVFPGGRVDPADQVGGSDDELASARHAAAREAFEEAGLELDPQSLVPYAHWTPPPSAPRRFVTWFFVAAAPRNAQVRIDHGEIREHAWMSARRALERRDAGEIELAVPTCVTLWDLAPFPTTEAVLRHVRGREPERFETCIVKLDDGAVALWQGDAGYESQDPRLEGTRHRLWMHASGWRYERGS